MDFLDIKKELEKQEIGDILVDEPMKKHTTLRAGGNAKLFIEINNLDSLGYVLNYCKQKDIDYFIVGKGSNLLFGDKEYNGIVLSLRKYLSNYHFDGCTLHCDGGVDMIPLAYRAMEKGLSGFEFMSGIPGTIGGGIYMNAGAYKYDIASVIDSVTYVDDHGNICTLSKEEANFSYRHSIFQDHPSWIVVGATFTLEHKDSNEIKEVVEKRKARRMETQPWDKPSAGSVFRNPDEKGAWYYIDLVGLRGYQIGGATVSLKHSNFIVNDNQGTASDVYNLIKHVQKTVKEKCGIELYTEVCFVNWE